MQPAPFVVCQLLILLRPVRFQTLASFHDRYKRVEMSILHRTEKCIIVCFLSVFHKMSNLNDQILFCKQLSHLI
jgi:hypothetical protein